MTDKSFTAEEVRANIAANRRHMTTETELQLTAYADTLSKPADSGRVDANCMDVLRRLRDMLPTVGICGWPAGVSALDEAISTLAAQGQGGDPFGWVNFIGELSQTQKNSDDTPVYLHPPASPAGVPDGWALVPREPTDAMLNAFMTKAEARNPADTGYAASKRWAATLAAAPSAPASPAGVLDEATDEFVPRWWDESHGDAYKEGWNDCRKAMLAAAPSAPEGDGGEG